MTKFVNRASLLAAGFIFSAVILLSLPAQAQAVDLFGRGVCDGAGANSTVCQDVRQEGNPLFGPNGVITFAIGLMSVIVGIAAVIMIIFAGLKFITSGSNPQEVTKARETLLYAVVGVLIAIFAQVLVRVVLSRI